MVEFFFFALVYMGKQKTMSIRFGLEGYPFVLDVAHSL